MNYERKKNSTVDAKRRTITFRAVAKLRGYAMKFEREGRSREQLMWNEESTTNESSTLEVQ